MSILEHTPGFGRKDAVHLAQELYGLRATATPLPSERDQNFLLDTESRERFVLKIANALGAPASALLELQNQAMAHLARHQVPCPRLVPTRTGDDMTEVRASTGKAHLVRLLTYLPGAATRVLTALAVCHDIRLPDVLLAVHC